MHFLDRLSARLIKCFSQGHKLLVAGNGGSAAQASHLAAELVGRFEKERKPLPCICLNSDQSIVTAIANDYGYGAVFARQVQAYGSPGDVLLLLTTSGHSDNLVNAAAAARALKMEVYAISGRTGGILAEHTESCIALGGGSAEIQEHHIVLIHELCRTLDAAFIDPVMEASRLNEIQKNKQGDYV